MKLNLERRKSRILSRGAHLLRQPTLKKIGSGAKKMSQKTSKNVDLDVESKEETMSS